MYERIQTNLWICSWTTECKYCSNQTETTRLLKKSEFYYISIWDFSDIESKDFNLVNIRVSMH